MLNALAAIGRFGRFSGAIATRVVRRPLFGGQVVEQTWTTTTRCLLPVIAVTFPFGMVMALLRPFGTRARHMSRIFVM